jgi:hypothetical protein
MKYILLALIFSSSSIFAKTIEINPSLHLDPGKSVKTFKYCTDINDNNIVKCRTLFINKDAKEGTLPLYERFEIFKSIDGEIIATYVDANTYFVANDSQNTSFDEIDNLETKVLFDQSYGDDKRHQVDLKYSENSKVKVSVNHADDFFDVNIKGIYLGKSYDEEENTTSVFHGNLSYDSKKVRIKGHFYTKQGTPKTVNFKYIKDNEISDLIVEDYYRVMSVSK